MSSSIPAMPLIGEWCHNTRKPTLFPFDQQSLSLWHNARAAIWHGAKALSLNSGERVLVPAYCCGSELDALLKADVHPVFYHVSKQLVPNLDHIEELCRVDSPHAILVTNYFGFPQPMREIRYLAQKYDLLIIEDNAHGLFSRNEDGEPLGSLGDIGIFSFVKTLPLPDGGGLLVNSPDLKQDQVAVGQRPDFFPIAGKAKYLFEQQCSARFPQTTNRAKKIIDPIVNLIKGKENRISEMSLTENNIKAVLCYLELKPERINWNMSALAQFLIRGFDPEQIVRVRRANYEYLLKEFVAIEGVHPLLTNLPANCCPMFFPIQSEQASELQRFLVNQGINAIYFWCFFHPAMPQDIFPIEFHLKKTVLALPIHQGLGENQMNRIIMAIREWVSK